MNWTAEPVKTLRDADGAECRDCSEVFGRYWQLSSIPWGWKQSKAMHERYSGHKMRLFKVVEYKP
jgi:hypothetical protein